LVKGSDFKVVGWGTEPSASLIAQHDVVKVSGYVLHKYPHVRDARHLVVDVYDPFPLENLHMYDGQAREEQYRVAAIDRGIQTDLIRSGDVLLCASDRQRDFWMGWLAAAGRVNPDTHDVDPSLERFVLVVPFGIPEDPPEPGPPRFRGVVPGIGADDIVVLWGGGVWNWFDPLTLIRAVAKTAERLPTLRLLFPAPVSPSPEVLPMKMSGEARRLSDELGVTDNRVFFGPSWIPYAQRGGVLLEADIGVSLHLTGVETRYSFRTRILDYLWAGLPILATEGDSMADLVSGENLGLTVPPEDVDAVADAMITLASNSDLRKEAGARSRRVGQRYRWSVVAQPLVEYCNDPYSAPDRDRIRAEARSGVDRGSRRSVDEAGRVTHRVLEVLSREGPAGVIHRSEAYLRRRFRSDAPRG
jgi:glycosyltransferase involved in cell wall biosynthesis